MTKTASANRPEKEPRDFQAGLYKQIIHLTDYQKRKLPFPHPLLDDAVDLPEDQYAPLVERHIAGDRTATDALILGNLVLVKWLVGRYMFHWPESSRFKDDMVSEGLLAVTQGIREIDGPVGSSAIRAILVIKVRSAIETFLNDYRSHVSASLSTNWRRVRDGRDPEYAYAEAVHGATDATGKALPGVDVCSYDETPTYIDVLDSLERLREVDSEEMVEMILLAIEQQHNLLEEELTDDERRLVTTLASIAA